MPWLDNVREYGYNYFTLQIQNKRERKLMVNESKWRKSLITLLCFSVFASSTVFAVPFKSVRSVGLLASMEALPNLEQPRSSGSFFDTLGPDVSVKGAVKTYSVRVVKRNEGTYSPASRDNKSVSDTDIGGPRNMIMPVMGRVSSLFGNRFHPTSKKIRFHTGVDIVARRGTPIISSKSGKVSFAGWRSGYGLMVVVDHGEGLQTVYGHCSKVAVKVGQTVNGGQRIAYVGSTGVATGSHLHFEVRRGGNVRNPFRYLSR
ncbi:MAG: hypothetical protein CVV41_15410 [Candidatus Riflebacteria bacterium HGW-Riflebacteria-1]|nr:MAG: hypothetical protein CVV41_15410 [Candidatus Riflebacteria bacterium HGW-Riflebacteria-1]